ncbi:substrate-binding periplasmic protein [Catenovulum maritimum]|uniref:Uncharacterized protein n=1 Tax=Catenovulum maritimum TaxID=1513271 RepID=A0A0J8GSJ5_9ALTE|nr:transporter substrate-binding domain-containing protein [Catenovulum maritimum]KMT63678.1 hypothetical protein XM47_18425 [Catenovulum maritimum]
MGQLISTNFYKRTLCLFVLISTPVFAELPNSTLIFAQNSLGDTFVCAQRALSTAYKKLGYDVYYRTLPNKRALKESNSGQSDGELLRVAGLEIEYPNLIRVPVPLCSVESVLIGKKTVKADRFEDLKNYSIGITTGFIDQEKLVREYNLKATRAYKNEILIELLLHKRVDLIFLTTDDAHKILNSPDGDQYKIIEGLNRDIYLYHYLHKQHQTLIPLITAQLEQMTKDGEIIMTHRVME